MKFLKDLFTAITGIFRRNKLIVTHSGNFHADDVFAAATLSILFNNKVRIIRTRDPEIIEKGDFVFDVGGVYDPELNRFDHHQTGGAGGRENGIPYASFGLVWKKFGIEICGSKETALYIDRELAEPIDAIDNGVEISKPFFSDVYPFTVTDVLDAFLPLPGDYSQSIDEIFLDVMNLAKRILIKEIEKEKKRQEIFPKVKEVYEVAPDKRIIVFDKKLPAGLLSRFPEPLFAIVPREKDWLLLTIRDNPKTFANRKDLPKEWAGLMNEKMAEVSGVIDATFCHNNLFLAAAKSKEGAIKLAELALNNK
ncbi:hypothetical protein A2645_00645 [Candidatus Nomurabacteria bacterium RIFCSPHIGHO2_01_FULL_39_9]|uniref:Metal-dependent hydrolase n=1 Tax=Candidatus Nomurabacteria bacterium RIFCSPHIGHO2_01_FULL_39_9 TaxID=1801735 RepID=A0A1F6UVC9_9BACT|nr:MAG: hypothetical protein A2645_00645 [Candidatus Nomurabacteria bacterium RIFCSPHIGHO2_01_FULL_39_9]